MAFVDPLLSEWEVSKLPWKEAVAHPNCAADLWWLLARDFPIEAIQSVLFPLLTLESPERWEALYQENCGNWFDNALERLTPAQRQLFVADCAERVLPLFESYYPGDTSARESIRLHRMAARGEWVGTQLAEAQRQTQEAVGIAPKTKAGYAAGYAGLAAIGHLEDVNWAALEAFREEDRRALLRWQWERIQMYINGAIR